jgi:hypothetical protein
MTKEYPPEVQKLISRIITLSSGKEDHRKISDVAFDLLHKWDRDRDRDEKH